MSAGCSLARLDTGLRVPETRAEPGQREGEQVKQRLHPHVRSVKMSFIPKFILEKSKGVVVFSDVLSAGEDGEP